MTAAVSMMGDLVRSVAAGQNLINNLQPEPPKVQFYNIRLGLGTSLNTSSSFPSVIATDTAKTKFFATFEEVKSVLTKPRRSYQDIPMSFLGARGSSQKRTDGSETREVAVQTTPPSNGFGLKSVDLHGGSEPLCISNIVIKASNYQSPREEIFIPIGDLGYLCGRKWSWGSVLEGNKQRCIWLDGQSDKSGYKELLHLDIERMAKIFKVDKNDELKRTDLSTACTYIGNKIQNDGLEDSIDEDTDLQQAISDLYNENQLEDQPQPDEIVVGEMRTEDLFAKKQVAIDQQDISEMIDGQEITTENLFSAEKILEAEEEAANEEFQMKKEALEEMLEDAEIQAEDNLLARQALEEERLLEDEIFAETVLIQQSENLSPEEMLGMELNLAQSKLEAEEQFAEKSLEEEKLLVEDELVAEENLAQETLIDEERIAEEELIAEEALAEERLAESFNGETSNEERLEAETELLKAEIAAEEDLLAREKFAEETLENNMLLAEQELAEDEMLAEQELVEDEILAEELEEEKMMLREAISNQNKDGQDFTGPIYSEQQSEESLNDWLEEQDISNEEFIDADFFPQVMTKEEYNYIPDFSEPISDEETYYDDIYQESSQDWLDEQELMREKADWEQAFDEIDVPIFTNSDETEEKDQTNAEVVSGISELKKRQTFTI
ncbi:putative secreted effector protein [Erysiphe necator]|uniref:Putative secreted effector protein n=1 Tax=Uncinula necator TaxID=52586 RepID=A0A0B1P0V9_UNCNE|nr:putative secreted effector protein [Erysiphe necator]